MYMIKVRQDEQDLFVRNDNQLDPNVTTAAQFRDYYEAAHQLAGALYPGNNGFPGSGNLKEPLLIMICYVPELICIEETFSPGG